MSRLRRRRASPSWAKLLDPRRPATVVTKQPCGRGEQNELPAPVSNPTACAVGTTLFPYRASPTRPARGTGTTHRLPTFPAGFRSSPTRGWRKARLGYSVPRADCPPGPVAGRRSAARFPAAGRATSPLPTDGTHREGADDGLHQTILPGHVRRGHSDPAGRLPPPLLLFPVRQLRPAAGRVLRAGRSPAGRVLTPGRSKPTTPVSHLTTR